MKEKYIELMEKALSAYTDEHIQRYFNDVKTNGLTEHGFPRLTANIGILIAHGRRPAKDRRQPKRTLPCVPHYRAKCS